jgi:hypothetical protein
VAASFKATVADLLEDIELLAGDVSRRIKAAAPLI